MSGLSAEGHIGFCEPQPPHSHHCSTALQLHNSRVCQWQATGVLVEMVVMMPGLCFRLCVKLDPPKMKSMKAVRLV